MVRLLPYSVVNAYILILFFLSNLLFPFALQKTHFLLSSQSTQPSTAQSQPCCDSHSERKATPASVSLTGSEKHAQYLCQTHTSCRTSQSLCYFGSTYYHHRWSWIILLGAQLKAVIQKAAISCFLQEFISTAICKLYKLGSITRSFQKKISFCWWLLFQSTKVSF